jgi:hypothetical protein
MELHGLLGFCWCLLSGFGKLVAGNYEEGWSRIDEEEQAMAADGGAGQNGVEGFFKKLQEEANECLVSFLMWL